MVNKEYYSIFADIHLLSYNKDSFLSSLGGNFLKTFYKAFLRSQESISAYVVSDEDQIIGFIIGCIQSKGFYKRLIKQNSLLFFFHGIQIIFSKPKAIIRLVKNLDKIKNKADDGNYCEILSIAVSSNYKNRGIGKELLKRFEEEALTKGCEKIALTTDYYNNENALALYKENGYKLFYEFTTHPNRKMYKLIKELKEK